MKQDRVLVGLIGRNILRSLSPALHEDAFAAAKLRGHYHLMEVDPPAGKTLDNLLAAARTAGFAGVNITHPYKEDVISLLDELSDEARQIGAVNTVVIERTGRTVGYNTDRIGFRRSFEETLGRAAIDGKGAVLIGAGGAGRAVAFALLDLGAARIFAYDTRGARAASLVANITRHFGQQRCVLPGTLAAASREAAGLVNATPVGMLRIPGMPVSPDILQSRHWVADVIYTPLETELVQAAQGRGAQVLTGGGMCVHQAAESFRLFTGIEPDVDRMRRLFLEAAAERPFAASTPAEKRYS